MKRTVSLVLCLLLASALLSLTLGSTSLASSAALNHSPTLAEQLPDSNQPVTIGPLLNGNFEEPDVSQITFDTYDVGETFGHWKVESGDVNHISEYYWQAANGRQSVDLSGCSAGWIAQDVPAQVGQRYLLLFALAGNPESGPAIKTIEVWWGNQLIDTLTFDITGHSKWNMGWGYHSYEILNQETLPKLSFKSRTGGCFGPVIDAISLTPIHASAPLLDLPIDYQGGKFAAMALGNTGLNSGRVTAWLDHFSPNNTENDAVTIWNGTTWSNTPLAKTDLQTNSFLSRYAYSDGHPGIDFLATQGNEWVYPAAAGTVVDLRRNVDCSRPENAYGDYVLIDHGSGYATFYAHLDQVNSRISVGTEITATQAITVGVMGSTCNQPLHLHFGLRYDADQDGKWEEAYGGYSEAVDPYGWLGAQPDPWGLQSNYIWRFPLSDSQTGSTAGTILNTPSGFGKFTFPAGAIQGSPLLELWDAPLPQPPGEASLRSLTNAAWLRAPGEPIGPGPFTVNLRYTDAETRHLDMSQVKIYHRPADSATWSPLSSTIDSGHREVSASATTPGYFSLQAPLVCPGDALETDDRFYQADLLEAGGAGVTRLFDIHSDEDWFRVQVSPGGAYRIAVTELAAGVVPALQLYDLDGVTLLQESLTGDPLSWVGQKQGSYYLRILPGFGSSSGCQASYRVSLAAPFHVFLPVTRRASQ